MARYRSLVLYLDDVLVIGATLAERQEMFECLLKLLENLGFGISLHKAVPCFSGCPYQNS